MDNLELRKELEEIRQAEKQLEKQLELLQERKEQIKEQIALKKSLIAVEILQQSIYDLDEKTIFYN